MKSISDGGARKECFQTLFFLYSNISGQIRILLCMGQMFGNKQDIVQITDLRLVKEACYSNYLLLNYERMLKCGGLRHNVKKVTLLTVTLKLRRNIFAERIYTWAIPPIIIAIDPSL